MLEVWLAPGALIHPPCDVPCTDTYTARTWIVYIHILHILFVFAKNVVITFLDTPIITQNGIFFFITCSSLYQPINIAKNIVILLLLHRRSIIVKKSKRVRAKNSHPNRSPRLREKDYYFVNPTMVW